MPEAFESALSLPGLSRTAGENSYRRELSVQDIICDPSLLIDLRSSLEQSYLTRDIDEASHAAYTQTVLHLKSMTEEISRFDWHEITEYPLAPFQARAILSCLPDPANAEKPNGPEHARLLFRLTSDVGDGYLNRRYENVTREGTLTNDWRGSLTTLRTFLDGATTELDDTRMLHTFFTLMTGRYRHVMDRKSLAWRSIFLGLRDIIPGDEEYFIMASEIDTAASTIARFFGTYSEFQEKSSAYTPMLMRFTKIFDSNIPSEYPDMNELGLYIQKNRPKFKILQQLINTSYNQVQRGSGLTSIDIAKTDTETKRITEMILRSGNTDLSRRVHALIPDDTIRQQLKDMTEMEAKRLNLTAVPFTMHGLTGYALLPATVIRPNEIPLLALKRIMENQNFPEAISHEMADVPEGSEIATIHANGLIFTLTRDQYAPVTELESALELLTPDDIRTHSMEVLNDVMSLRTRIANGFNRAVTYRGVSYDYAATDLAPVLSELTLKRNRNGGFAATVTTTRSETFGLNPQHVSAEVRLSPGSTTVSLGNEAANLPPHIEWFLKREILRVVEVECCRNHGDIPFLDDTGSILQSGEGQPHDPEDQPGQIVHIGVKKKSGAPGEHTLRAETTMIRDVFGESVPATIEAVKAFYEASGGKSLVEMNQKHKEEHPDCPHNVTWRTEAVSNTRRDPVARRIDPSRFPLLSPHQ